MALEIRKAERKKAKLRIGLSAPAGGGKTWSALLIAKGLAPWDKIALIDTENGSGELYSHLGAYNYLPLNAPFTPENYTEAIRACEKAGMEVIIIDSASHEWDGKGGCLESNELLGQTKFKGNNWAAWSVTTPRHQKFIEAITSSRCHVITTARSKTDTIQTEDKKIKKVGLKDIQREGFEYELTVAFNLDREGHYATASKDRTSLFIHRDPFVINEEIGQQLLQWAGSGVEDPATESITKEQDQVIKDLATQLATEWTKINQWVMGVKHIGIYELTKAQATEIIGLLAKRLAQKRLEDKQDEETNKILNQIEAKEEGKPIEISAEDAAAQLDKALGNEPRKEPESEAARLMRVGLETVKTGPVQLSTADVHN